MENRKGVEKLMTVFNLTDCNFLNSTAEAATRVMLVYEMDENRMHFTILDRNMSQHLKAQVTTWLEENFDFNGIRCSA